MLVDVRTPEEYASEHAPGAVNIPLNDIMIGNLGVLADIDRATPLRLYCRSGARSENARTLLISTGFTNVINIGGLADAMHA